MELVLTIHGFVRWLAAIMAIAAIIKFGIGFVRKQPYTGMDRGLMSGYAGFLDLNLLLGLILLFVDGIYNMERIEHATTMIIAIVLAHSSAAWKKSDSSNKKFRNNLIVVLLSIVVVFMGVTRLRGGWTF
ncbi:MAG: hypothetical protein GY943_31320 [Chloroflexi bacterium]|nr:hypothetical protein [Chloroflexota bacterium]